MSGGRRAVLVCREGSRQLAACLDYIAQQGHTLTAQAPTIAAALDLLAAGQCDLILAASEVDLWPAVEVVTGAGRPRPLPRPESGPTGRHLPRPRPHVLPRQR